MSHASVPGASESPQDLSPSDLGKVPWVGEGEEERYVRIQVSQEVEEK